MCHRTTAVKFLGARSCSRETELCHLELVNCLHQQSAVYSDIARTILVLAGGYKNGDAA
jgi:hypothetical protein